MDELIIDARALYLDLEATVDVLTTIDEVVVFTSENDIDLEESLQWLIKAMLFQLSIADGVVCDEEVEFIRQVLNEEVYDSVILSITEDHNDSLKTMLEAPVILSLLANYDMEIAFDIVEKIQTIGIYFIAIDGDSDDREASLLTSIIDSMTQCISDTLQELQEDTSDLSLPEEVQSLEKDNDLSLEDLLEELHSLIGLDIVKDEVLSLANLVKVHQLRLSHNMPIPPMSFHLVFSGNPGTGKTTVARLLSKIYKALGLLSRGHLVEVDRSGLVAGYVGQTAIKVSDIIKESLGGILFIDEAYSLVSNQDSSDFGSEAIETLLKAMEDNRDDLVIIVAGYTDKMDSFLQSNPGLKSRFNKFIHFNDYKSEEMLNIFLSLCKKSEYIVTKDARQLLANLVVFLDKNRSDNFGNGREIRNKFEIVLQHQANRIMSSSTPTKEELQTITSDDISPLLPQ